MKAVEVLVLHGSPGSGKTTLSRAVSEVLRHADIGHAVIDLDDLDHVHPHRGRTFCRDNLRVMWPNYTALAPLKVVISSVIADVQERAALRAAAPSARFVVCELTAPEAVLKSRVRCRESDDYWRARLSGFVDLYHRRTDLELIRDFKVNTHGKSVQQSAHEVLQGAGWRAPRP